MERSREKTLWYMSDFSGVDLPASALNKIRPHVHLYSSGVQTSQVPEFKRRHPKCRQIRPLNHDHVTLRCELPPARGAFTLYASDLLCRSDLLQSLRGVVLPALYHLQPDGFVLRLDENQYEEVQAAVMHEELGHVLNGYVLEVGPPDNGNGQVFLTGIKREQCTGVIHWPAYYVTSTSTSEQVVDMWQGVFEALLRSAGFHIV